MSELTVDKFLRNIRRGHVLSGVREELDRQDAKWGPDRDIPDSVSGCVYWLSSADYFKEIMTSRAAEGRHSYADILLEEVAEAIDEARAGDKYALRAELIQVAAVCAAWAEKLDREFANSVHS